MTERQDSGMCFLLVDDEASLRQALARSLGARGHRVDQASTAEDAVAALTEADTPYDLLLLDINLPDASGWDVLRAMRQSGTAIPTVVFSAIPPSVQRVREFRPLGVLTKPFPIDALLRFVAMVQEVKQA